MITINHIDLKPFISPSRLTAYNTFFQPKNDIELFGCYLWNKEVVSAFFPLLQVFEVTLRNAIHTQAQAHLVPCWFDNLVTQPPGNLNSKQRNNVSFVTNTIQKTRKDIRRNMNLLPTTAVSEDKIIAKLMFGFWTNLFSSAFEVNRNSQALWPKLLRPVFPNAPKGARSRIIIEGKLLSIKTFRNKAFHHGPVWNIGRPTDINHAIENLLTTKDLMLQLLEWISLDSVELVKKAGYINTISRTCSIEHLNYLQHPGINDKPIALAKRELRGILRNANKTTDITRNGLRIGKIICDPPYS